MQLKIIIISVCLFGFPTLSEAQTIDINSAIESAKNWWHAVTFGDTAYVKNNSTNQLTVTFNSGRSFNYTEMIKQVASHNPQASIKAEWSQIAEQLPSPTTSIVTNRIVETVGKTVHVYKFITVLTRINSNWMVTAAQSTREIELAPAIPLSQVGKLSDFAGSYKTSSGVILKIVVQDTSLVLVEPSGVETRLEGIGPGLFEIPKILSAGNVRFVFSRDESGRIISMTRITHLITTMQRMQ